QKLECGVYLVVMRPDNNYFQVLVSDNEQRFSLEAHKDNPTASIQFTGAPDNKLFYEYLNYLSDKRPLADTLRAQVDRTTDEGKKKNLQDKLDKLNAEVEAYQTGLISKHKGTLTASIIKANLPFNTPEFDGATEEEKQIKKWHYTRDHYFDNLDVTDPCMLRTPFLFQRIEYFVQKLHVQHPDSIAIAIDAVLEKLRPSQESFKFYMIHFLNYYARSNIVGMDAVYVHMVEKYYATGQAPWTEAEQLKKIVDNANVLRPILIGKIAPDIKLQKRDGTPFSLHEVDSEYTILYFWRHDCGHCKKSTPVMKEFYEKFKDKGVKIVAVCAKFTDEVPKCWEYVDENHLENWIQAVDPYHRSRFSTIYDLKTTPQIFVLDRKKEILSKKIGAEQLEELMNKIIEMKQKQSHN
ncbi:MAG: redoxin domain-containing protein, partial [Saprospiraceae bacterium]|nr:redoxin domain-containing protein [Saprospiraceae bacterium]